MRFRPKFPVEFLRSYFGTLPPFHSALLYGLVQFKSLNVQEKQCMLVPRKSSHLYA